MTNSENEQQLIAEACRGDRQALGQLLTLYAPQLRKRIEGKIDSRWQSQLNEDDILQQTFADAFLGITRFQWNGPGSFIAWLSTLARNNLNDAVKHLQTVKSGGRERRASTSSDESYHQLMHHIAASTSTPSFKAARGESQRELLAALERLPANYRAVIQGYDLDGTPADVLAEQLKCSTGALYMRRSRALSLLAELLGG